MLRASEGGRKLMAAWLAQRSNVTSTQKALNAMLQAEHAKTPAVQSTLNKDLLMHLGGAVAIGNLRATGFENAYTYFVAKLHQVPGGYHCAAAGGGGLGGASDGCMGACAGPAGGQWPNL
jgi:hypothetical protein